MNKHTPGPWEAKPSVVLSENVVFWSVFSGDSFLFPHCNEADAHLMAAAPEMLEALKMLEAVDFGAGGSVERGARMARIAIAKARGEAC